MTTTIDTLHKKAMEFTDEALLAKRRGVDDLADSFFEKAYFLEKEAALAYQVTDENDQLYKSILVRSAASLALDCGYLWEADYLVQLGLDENVHPAIQDELEELLVKIDTQKKAFAKNEVQITGTVISADATINEIKVFVFNTHKHYTVFIPKGKIHEIVRLYWAKKVTIQGKTDKKGIIFLQDIQQAA